MYDPLELGRVVEEKVKRIINSEVLRAYFRFRKDRWYGGVVTADVIGCNLRCKFCWAHYFTWNVSDDVLRRASFLAPDDVAERLAKMAKRYGIKQARLSGGEPTLVFNHLVKVIDDIISRGLHVIIETNGILLGSNDAYARDIAKFSGSGIEVRISIKGVTPDEFAKLTGAVSEAWYLQIEALRKLVSYGLEVCDEVYPAVMLSFSSNRDYKRFKKLLRQIDPRLTQCIDEEYVIMYNHVKDLLLRSGLRPKKYFTPGNIPKEFI